MERNSIWFKAIKNKLIIFIFDIKLICYYKDKFYEFNVMLKFDLINISSWSKKFKK
jgi:hypothetical protein